MRYTCLMVVLALACASSGKSPPSDTPDDGDYDSDWDTESDDDIDPNAGEGLPPPQGPPEECLDEQGEPIECLSDADCCEGFYCGIDPEGSTRIKTCVYGGG
jgi:hypothetical protein